MGGGDDKNKEKGGVDPSTQKGSVTFDWKQLPVSILRAFLIFIPDKEPYKMNPEDVIKLDDEAVAGAVIAYDKMCGLGQAARPAVFRQRPAWVRPAPAAERGAVDS